MYTSSSIRACEFYVEATAQIASSCVRPPSLKFKAGHYLFAFCMHFMHFAKGRDEHRENDEQRCPNVRSNIFFLYKQQTNVTSARCLPLTRTQPRPL